MQRNYKDEMHRIISTAKIDKHGSVEYVKNGFVLYMAYKYLDEIDELLAYNNFNTVYSTACRNYLLVDKKILTTIADYLTQKINEGLKEKTPPETHPLDDNFDYERFKNYIEPEQPEIIKLMRDRSDFNDLYQYLEDGGLSYYRSYMKNGHSRIDEFIFERHPVKTILDNHKKSIDLLAQTNNNNSPIKQNLSHFKNKKNAKNGKRDKDFKLPDVDYFPRFNKSK